jgi:acetylornithine deacetylase/succinyl-diaminopimelate desuccinylase-like protein
MLFEGDEESGSAHIYHYLEKLTPRIGIIYLLKLGTVALVICLDSGCGNYEQLWFTSTLRGFVGCIFTVTTCIYVKVTVLKEGVHSGDASGVVPSSFRIARQLLDRIEDPKTGEVHDAF